MGSHRIAYLVVVAAAAVGTLLLTLLLPDEYAAQVKLSDEYKVTDLAVGLSHTSALLREVAPNSSNSGTDDIEVYAHVLSSDHFLRRVAAIKVGTTSYYHYLFPYDTTDSLTTSEVRKVGSHLAYNLYPRSQTLDVRVTDRSPRVAQVVLDSVVSLLRADIEAHRRERAEKSRDAARLKLDIAKREYEKALSDYDRYAEGHESLTSQYYAKMLSSLQRNYQKRFDIYSNAVEQYTRADYLTQKAALSFTEVKHYALSTTPVAPRRWAYALAAALIAAMLCLWHHLYRRRQGQAMASDLGNWFAPWTISLLVWAVILGLYTSYSDFMYPITEQFYLTLALWLPLFCICALVTYLLLPAVGRRSSSDAIAYNPMVFNVLFALTMVLTPIYLHRVLQIVLMFSTEDLMSNIRILAVYGEGQGLLNHTVIVNQALLLVALWGHPRIPLWQVVALALACLLNAFAIMEKGTMFFVFLAVVFVLFEKRVIRLHTIVLSGLALFMVFYFFNLVRAGNDEDIQEKDTLLDFLAMYVLSPPVAFSQLMPDLTPQFGANTFETIYHFLRRFGFDDVVEHDKIKDFVWVPIPTNVYTMFQPFWVDFGLRGVAFFAMVYGVVSGWLYWLYKQATPFGRCLYTFWVYVLVLQFYQENVFLSIVFVFELSFFVAVATQQLVAVTFNPRKSHGQLVAEEH